MTGIPAVVKPIRFTDRVAEMSAFLELLGLRRVLHADRDWVELRGRGGGVSLHSLSGAGRVGAVSTGFNLEVPDAAAAATLLEESELAAAWWDESFGRLASVAGPLGRMSISEAMTDTYGYQVDPDAAPSEVDVVATITTDADGAARAFFARFGFEPAEGPAWGLRGAQVAGIIGLLPGRPSDGGDDWMQTALGFETLEPLAALAARLTEHRHPLRDETRDARDPRLIVTDPDGILIEIHPAIP